MTCSCGLPLVLTFCPWCAGFEDPVDPTAQRQATILGFERLSATEDRRDDVVAGLLPQPLHAAVEQAVRRAADEAQAAGRSAD